MRIRMIFLFFILNLNINANDLLFLIPKDNETLYCIGGSKEENEILSIDTSNAKARVHLAKFVKESIISITKEIFNSFNAINNIPEYEEAIKRIGEDVYKIVLKNANDDRVFYNRRDGVYYVRVVFDIKILRDSFEKIIRDNGEYLIKLKMNRPLSELIIRLKDIKRRDFYKNDDIFLIH